MSQENLVGAARKFEDVLTCKPQGGIISIALLITTISPKLVLWP
jgi:hypothetical protein